MSAALPFGLLAVFDSPERLVEAARTLRDAGYRRLDAHTPFPVPELAEVLGLKSGALPWVILIAAVVGGALGYFLQYYSVMIDYPINVGGKPIHSWPSFLVITFEMTVLGGTLGALFGMLALNRLPAYYHPLFNAADFTFAEGNRFFLSVEAADPRFHGVRTRRLLEGLEPLAVEEIAP